MTTKMSIRDLSRNSDKLLEYDYVEIVNNRSKEARGIFVPARYVEEVKSLLDQKLKREREEKLRGLRKFEGMLDGLTADRKAGEIKANEHDS